MIEWVTKASLYCPFKFKHTEFRKMCLRFEAWKPGYVKRMMGVYMTDLYREIWKPVLRLDFTAHEKMASLSEFGLRKTYLSAGWGKGQQLHLLGQKENSSLPVLPRTKLTSKN
jgi:hypothetical protein